ncbi:hypothetical protein [Variovorax sp. R-27]|uniref:hypothetical protein n=1 Tax=Variovorax sp. R-27 TaxID=3404058 RepID=UPI003CF87AC8
MAHFILTFRIAADASYQARYESFVQAVVTFAGGPGRVWDETTSFYAFEANSTADSVVRHLWVASDFDSSKDMMVVLDLDAREKATKGPVPYVPLLTAYVGF